MILRIRKLYGNSYSGHTDFLSLLITVQVRSYSARPLLSISTVTAVLALHSTNHFFILIILNVCNTLRSKRIQLKCSSKVSVWRFRNRLWSIKQHLNYFIDLFLRAPSSIKALCNSLTNQFRIATVNAVAELCIISLLSMIVGRNVRHIFVTRQSWLRFCLNFSTLVFLYTKSLGIV